MTLFMLISQSSNKDFGWVSPRDYHLSPEIFQGQSFWQMSVAMQKQDFSHFHSDKKNWTQFKFDIFFVQVNPKVRNSPITIRSTIAWTYSYSSNNTSYVLKNIDNDFLFIHAIIFSFKNLHIINQSKIRKQNFSKKQNAYYQSRNQKKKSNSHHRVVVFYQS